MEFLNPLTHNDHYRGRTAPLTSKCCILYIYSTNIGTGYFKHVIYSPFFSLQNTVCFIILTYLVPVLFIFYIQGVLKFKNNNSGAKRVIIWVTRSLFYLQWSEQDSYSRNKLLGFYEEANIIWTCDKHSLLPRAEHVLALTAVGAKYKIHRLILIWNKSVE